jgi:hypothetical protein
VLKNGGFRANMKIQPDKDYDKSQCPHTRWTYQGLRWDSHSFKISIGDFKRDNVLHKFVKPADTGTMTLRELASLTGSLNWVSAIWGTAPYKRALMDLQAAHLAGRTWSKKLAVSLVTLPAWFVRTAQLWRMMAELMNESPIDKGIRQLVCPYKVYSDASSTAWGFVVKGLGVYDRGDFPVAWKPFIDAHSKFREIWINTLEAFALLRAARFLLPRFPNCRCTFYTDNAPLLHQVRRLSAGGNVEPVMRELAMLCATFGCSIQCCFVKSELNVHADYETRVGHEAFTADQQRLLDNFRAVADAERLQAEAAGLLRLRPPARPELLALLEADRCQALELDLSWSRQRHDELIALLDAREACHARYLARAAAHSA